MVAAAARPTTLVTALKAGAWEAARMTHQLDEDLLPPDCPFPGELARCVWDCLRELQLAYQDRHTGWRQIPARFERLARALATVVALEPVAAVRAAPEGIPLRPMRSARAFPVTNPERLLGHR